MLECSPEWYIGMFSEANEDCILRKEGTVLFITLPLGKSDWTARYCSSENYAFGNTTMRN